MVINNGFNPPSNPPEDGPDKPTETPVEPTPEVNTLNAQPTFVIP